MSPSLVFGLIGAFVLIAFAVAGATVLRKRNLKKNLQQADKAEKELDAIREAVKPVEQQGPVVPLASESREVQGQIESLEEFPIGAKIGIELTRIKEGTTKRIVVMKGFVQIKVGRFGRDPRKFLFFVIPKGAFYVNPKKIITVKTEATRFRKAATVYKLVYDILYSEPLNQGGTITYDDELEMILADSSMDQYVTIAAFEGGFVLSPTLKKVMMILGVLGFFIGLAVNSSAHVISPTVIHWIPTR